MQHLISTAFKDASECVLCPNPEITSRAIKLELFDTDSLDNLNCRQLKLPWHPNEVLAHTKIKSLSIKYDTIPEDFLAYYPQISNSSGSVGPSEPVEPSSTSEVSAAISDVIPPREKSIQPARKRQKKTPGAVKPGPSESFLCSSI